MDPIGPGFFIFFQDEEIEGSAGPKKKGRKYREDSEEDIMLIICAILQVIDD